MWLILEKLSRFCSVLDRAAANRNWMPTITSYTALDSTTILAAIFLHLKKRRVGMIADIEEIFAQVEVREETKGLQ